MKTFRLYPVLSPRPDVVSWGVVPLGVETQLFRYPYCRVHSILPPSPRISSPPHPAIQIEILRNFMTRKPFVTILHTDLIVSLHPVGIHFCTINTVENDDVIWGSKKTKLSFSVLLQGQTPRIWARTSRVFPLSWPRAAAASLSLYQVPMVERAVRPHS